MNRPEVHEIYRDWREIADASDPPRVLVGETWIFDLREVARFYGATGDELNLCFNFPFVFADLDAETLRRIVETTEDALEPFAQPAWAGSNHDVGRFATRWCGDRPDATRCALLMLLTLRGTPFLYFGDEIGMVEVPVTGDDVRDPAGELGTQPGRDPGRTPMQWNAGPGAGFTREGVRPWLPIGNARANNVEDQRRDPGSVLRLCRDLIALRRETSDLRSGAYASLPSPPGAWSWRRGPSTIDRRQSLGRAGHGAGGSGDDRDRHRPVTRRRDGRRRPQPRPVGGSSAARRSRLRRTRWSARPTLVNGRIGASRTAASGTTRTVTNAQTVATSTASILAFHGRSTSERRATIPPAPIPATNPVTASAASAETGMPIDQRQAHRLGHRTGRARMRGGEREDDEHERHQHEPERDPADPGSRRPPAASMRRRPRRSGAPSTPARAPASPAGSPATSGAGALGSTAAPTCGDGPAIDSALDGAGRQTAHEVLLQREEHDERKDHRDERRRRQQVPGLSPRTHQPGERDRQAPWSAACRPGTRRRPGGRSTPTGTGRSRTRRAPAPRAGRPAARRS